MGIIKEAKFGKLKDVFEDKKYIPSFFVYKNQLYKFELTKSEKREIERQRNKNNYEFIANFETQLNIKFIRAIYNLLYKNNEIKEFIDSNIDSPFTKTNKIIFKNNIDVFFDDAEQWGKITENTYVNLFSNQYGSPKHLYNLLCIISKIVKETGFKGLKLYVCEQEKYDSDEYNKELKKYLFLYKKNFNIKDGNRFLAYTDGKIFNSKELLLKKINNKFSSMAFIGEMPLKEEEKDILYSYTNSELKRYVNEPSKFTPKFEKLFALGLVKQSYETYKGNNFWGNLKNKTGVTIDSNKQARLINVIFKNIMIKNKKVYDDSVSDYYHNVLMHNFVSKAYWFDFFDYLFAYWNFDLDRNIEGSLYDVNGKFDTKFFNESLFNDLNDGKDEQKVRLHTKLAIKNNDKVSKNKIKQLIKIINDLWFDENSIDNYGIAGLLNAWKDDTKHDFYKQRYKERKETKERKKHDIAYHSPTIKYYANSQAFKLYVPKQRIRELEEKKELIWKITGFEDRTEIPYATSRGYYTESFELEIKDNDIFNEFRIVIVDSDNKKYSREFVIDASNLRMFDDKGNINSGDGQNLGITQGRYTMFSKDNNFPTVLNQPIESNKYDDMYISSYTFKKGDIVILNDHLIKIGLKTESGLSKVLPMDDVIATFDNEEYQLYNQLPSYLFFSKKSIKGSKLYINDNSYNIEPNMCDEFSIKDEINENQYGYLLDLSKFVDNDGIYNVKLNITGNKLIQQTKFIYIKDFAYEFKNAPYLYKKTDSHYYGIKDKKKERVDKGTIEFSKKYTFLEEEKTPKLWMSSSTIKYYDFIFGTKSKNLNDNVIEDKLHMHLYLNGNIIDLSFVIPTLYWKRNDNDAWSCSDMGNLTLGESKKFYLKGPEGENGFNFNTYVFLKSKKSFKEKLEKSKDGTYYSFNLDDWNFKIKSDRDQFEKYEQIVIDEENELIGDLFSIVCKSSLSKIEMNFVEDRKHINIKCNIVGSNNYIAIIKDKNDNIVEENITLDKCNSDPNFKYEANICLEEEIIDDMYYITILESDSDLYDFEDEVFSEVRTTQCNLKLLEKISV